VLYVFGYGGQVFAFDAASGRQLWRYQRRVPQGTQLNSRKTIALYADKLYTATSDNHMVALDARTGRPVWDVAMTDRPGMRIPGGPLAADGVIMQGFANNAAGGGVIVAVDAETGKKLWEFDTVAKPGQLGGDSWNGVPGADRKGGSVWTSGSYDPVNKLALWGVGNTYDTKPLRDLNPGMSNDALFTESTLAFEPRTGSWCGTTSTTATTSTISTGCSTGWSARSRSTGSRAAWSSPAARAACSTRSTRRPAVHQDRRHGHPGLHRPDRPGDRRQAREGRNDPGRDKGPVFMCPHGGGGRNWSPTSYIEATQTLFVNARDVCTDLTPSTTGGLLTTGSTRSTRRRPTATASTACCRRSTCDRADLVGRRASGRPPTWAS
jgi:alcohol dehydrogenase (cytochrome c)